MNSTERRRKIRSMQASVGEHHSSHLKQMNLSMLRHLSTEFITTLQVQGGAFLFHCTYELNKLKSKVYTIY